MVSRHPILGRQQIHEHTNPLLIGRRCRAGGIGGALQTEEEQAGHDIREARFRNLLLGYWVGDRLYPICPRLPTIARLSDRNAVVYSATVARRAPPFEQRRD
jgi:hypothetical protein